MAVGCVAAVPRGSAGDAPAGATRLKIGMLEGMFRDVQPAMVQAMSIPFRAMFERQTGYTGDVEIVPDAEILSNKLKDQRLNLGVFHGFEYAQVRARHRELQPLVVTMPHGRICQACVVVAKSNKAQKLADLTGEALVIPRGTKAHCLVFLDKARRGLPAAVATPTPKPAQSVEEVLNAVVEGTYSAGLVDIGAFNGYLNLQPGASQHLKVLCRSEVFPVSVIAYRKGSLDDEAVAQIKQGLIGANLTPQGKPLMMLWNLKGFEDIPADYDIQLENTLKAYPSLPLGTSSHPGK
jgi:ABC-type phosphate/phosphonate transport system substrate-binding protein